jgi:hypothetical protein
MKPGKKKDEQRAMSIVTGMEEMHQESGVSLRRLCAMRTAPYSSLMRWRQRMREGEPVVQPRGAQCTPMTVAKLWERLLSLPHGRHRSQGSREVYEAYRGLISRRELRWMLKMLRLEISRDKAALQRRIEWKAPGLVWAMDDMEIEIPGQAKLFLNQVQDLGSRYKFMPGVGCKQLTGPEIAERLERLFLKFGAPLFLKRDNGGNLNHPAVDAVLDKFLVIPLNSPVDYPPYNGAIEKAQREFREAALARVALKTPAPFDQELYAEGIINDLNHTPRACLSGQCACFRLHAGLSGKKKYTRPQRKEVYDQIISIATQVMEQLDVADRRAAEAAWRLSVETWLRQQSLITVTVNGKVLPGFL